MGLKVSVLMMAYNSFPLIAMAINSIIDFCDELVIVEGPWLPDKPPRSTDETLGVINNYRKNNPDKIKLLHYEPTNEIDKIPSNPGTHSPLGLTNQLRARQMGLDQCTGDLLFIVDSDEVYKLEDLRNIKNHISYFVQGSPDIAWSFKIHSYVFYFDYNFCVEEHFLRFYRQVGKGKFYFVNSIQYETSDQPHITLDREVGSMYHYSYVGQNVKEKIEKWNPELTKGWYEEVFLPALKEGPKEGTNYHLFKNIGYGTTNYKKFKGTHPQSMQEFLRGPRGPSCVS